MHFSTSNATRNLSAGLTARRQFQDMQSSSRLDTLLNELKQSSPCAPLILNNFCLKDIPEVVWKDEFCCGHLKEIFLKNNSISTLVGDK